jgi:cysteine-rich repeat protein
MGMKKRIFRAAGGAIVCAALALLISAHSTALAHVQPIPIERWGPFLPGTPRCLRMISRVTHVCYDRVLSLLQQCNDAQVRGGECDMDAVESAIGEATQPLHQALTRQCELAQLTEIGYIGVPDAEADLFGACVTQARDAVAAIYAPARPGAPSETAAECMVASAAYAREVIRFAIQQEVPVMERIATRLFTTEEKMDSIRRIETELSAARPRWVTGLSAACPQFATVYGRSADSFLRTMKQRADCVLSRTYVHTAINCPGAICGNGIPEAGEECDDGNRDDTDMCLTNCSLP